MVGARERAHLVLRKHFFAKGLNLLLSLHVWTVPVVALGTSLSGLHELLRSCPSALPLGKLC